MLHQVEHVDVTGPSSLRFRFEDGSEREADLAPLLFGEVFEPLRDAGYFRKVKVDTELGTVVWPNGADLCPDALYQMSRPLEKAK